LGSFGDNELSPECLDGAQRFLKHDGINIPVSYTALIAPVQTSRLWQVYPFQIPPLFSFDIRCWALFPHARLCFAWSQDIKNFEKADAWETAYVRALLIAIFMASCFGHHSQLTNLQLCRKDER